MNRDLRTFEEILRKAMYVKVEALVYLVMFKERNSRQSNRAILSALDVFTSDSEDE